MKTTLVMVAACAALSALGVRAEERPAIPAWAEQQIDAAVARLKAWQGTNETVVFSTITDVHSYKEGLKKPLDWSDPKTHILFLLEGAKRSGSSFVADLGDIDFEHESKTPERLQLRFDNYRELYSGMTVPVLFCVGNHDQYPALFGRLNEFSGRLGANVVMPDEKKTWGYYDVPGKKFRAIFLNTSEESYYGYSEKQVRFFADALKLPEGWTAAVFQHLCTYAPMGSVKPRTREPYYGKRADAIGRIAEDFVARKAGQGGGASWDFTALKDARLIGFFTGDSHFDNAACWRGVHYTLTQGYGFTSRCAYGGRFRSFDRTKEMLFEIGAWKPATGEFRLFRVGCGGAEADRFYWVEK